MLEILIFQNFPPLHIKRIPDWNISSTTLNFYAYIFYLFAGCNYIEDTTGYFAVRYWKLFGIFNKHITIGPLKNFSIECVFKLLKCIRNAAHIVAMGVDWISS